MPQKYRIYINDNSLSIGKNPLNDACEFQQLDSQNFDFPTFYKNLKHNSGMHFQLITDHPKRDFNRIRKDCTLIKAAGGLVKNASGNYLFIFRNRKWDLPKGKVEKLEKNKQAALREVEEECGVKIHKRHKKLCSTFHTYMLGGEIVLKKTAWYTMSVKGIPKLVPQLEEGITKAEWIPATEIAEKLTNTYPLISDVLAAADL